MMYMTLVDRMQNSGCLLVDSLAHDTAQTKGAVLELVHAAASERWRWIEIWRPPMHALDLAAADIANRTVALEQGRSHPS